jgi:pyridoxal phosphate enzyme (YggS family)
MVPDPGEQLLRRARENYARVLDSIRSLPGGEAVRLICVTKYASLPAVRALLEAGASDLGENRLPEGMERFTSLRSEGFSFARHLIGAQQSRKLKLIPGNFELFQALDRPEAAQALQKVCAEQGKTLNVLMEINIGGEVQKHGFSSGNALDTARQTAEICPALRLRGLMAIPPGPQSYASASEFERATQGHFEQMRSLFDKIGAVENLSAGWNTLSMGMSQDYRWAVRAGATMVRIGSALFEGMEG